MSTTGSSTSLESVENSIAWRLDSPSPPRFGMNQKKRPLSRVKECIEEEGEKEEGKDSQSDDIPLSFDAEQSIGPDQRPPMQRTKTFVKIDYKKVDGITKFKNAALYLYEGENNDKFFHHPRSWWSYLAFHLVHNEAYQYTQLAISLLLMGLAIIEPPTYIKGIPPWVHTSLEMVFLLFFAVDSILQLIWLQPKAFITQKRTLIKIFIIAVLYAEAIIVTGRMEVHVRILRSLRPFFFVDCFVTAGVRRVLRQIIQSLGPIIDILLLYILAVALFALIAFLLFGSYDDIFFINFRETFVNMFIAQTSANFPDVMMKAYSRIPYTPLFFIFYIIFQFYIISNMLLALVYSTFQGRQLEKFKKLYVHKKESMKRVFEGLQRKDVVHFADFYLLMKAYLPNASKIRVLCVFKALDTTKSNCITLPEFYKFYDILDLSWSRIDRQEGKSIIWHRRLPRPIHRVLLFMGKVIEWPFFDLIVNIIIVINGIFLWAYTSSIELSADGPYQQALNAVQENEIIFNVSLAFTCLYAAELTVKVFVLGPPRFFSKAWNTFDFVLVIVSISGHIFEASLASVFIFLRPLRLLRLLRLKRRYRDMMNTLIVLLPQLLNIALVLVVVFYFYAIIGMEFLANTVQPNCCQSDGVTYPVDSYYRTGNNSVYYFLNNFDGIFRSFVTLFELMFVNNWHVMMEGFRLAKDDSTVRLFFISFSLCTEVLLTIIIAYIIDTFVLQYKVSEKLREQLRKKWNSMTLSAFFCQPHQSLDASAKRTVDVDIQMRHIEGLESINAITVVDRIVYQLHRESDGNESDQILRFRGRRNKKKDDINHLLYSENIQAWDEEFDRGEDHPDSPDTAASRNAPKAVKFIKWFRNLLDDWLL